MERLVVSRECVYGAAVTGCPRLPPSTRNWTLATPILLEALAVTAIVADTVAPFAGEVMETVGATGFWGGGVALDFPLTIPEQPTKPRLETVISRRTNE